MGTSQEMEHSKVFSQAELRQWIEAILETDAIAIAPGVFFGVSKKKMLMHSCLIIDLNG